MLFAFINFVIVEVCFPQNIAVVMSADDNYFRPTVVAMTSMFENADSNTFFMVNILCDFTHKDKRRMVLLEKKYEKKCKIELIDMGDKYKNMKRAFPAPAYFRLEICSILPGLKKCVYLDGDVLVRHDLSEMYNINISDYYVAGVCNSLKHLPENLSKILGIPNLNQYVCSGVLLMNLEKMRENEMEGKFFKFMKDIGVENLRYADQDVINRVCYGKILRLPLKFCLLENLVDIRELYEKSHYAQMYSTPEDWMAKDPKIVHFAGGGKPFKPWRCVLKSTFYWEWWTYARKTGLYDKEIKSRRMGKHKNQKKNSLHRL